jgi:Lysine methyltransferase
MLGKSTTGFVFICFAFFIYNRAHSECNKVEGLFYKMESESSIDTTASCTSSSNAAEPNIHHQPTVSFAQDILVHDPVLFLAIIEFDTGGGYEDMCFHTKLRIRASEVRRNETSVRGFTARALRQRIQQHLCAGSRKSSHRHRSDYHIALYDSDAEDYVSLSDVNEEDDIVPQFGTRWRIRVTEPFTGSVNASTESAPLAIQGRYFHVPPTGSFIVANCELQFQQIDSAVNTSTGFQIWDGAVWLTRYLEQNPALLRNHPRVLELGAGCGVVGISAALLGAPHVLLTDLPELLPLLQSNIDRNRAMLRGEVACRPCDWTQPLPLDLPPVDLILVADCVWMEHLVAPLLHTLRQLTDLTTMHPNTSMEEVANQSLSHMDLANGSAHDPSPVNSWADIYKGRTNPSSLCHLHNSSCLCLQEPLDASFSDHDTDMSAVESLDRSFSDLERHCAAPADVPSARNTSNERVPPRVIISYQRRGKSTHEKFWKGLRELFSHVERLPLPTMEGQPQPAADVYYLLSCQR